MNEDYILVAKKIMPQSYQGVLSAKKLIDEDGYSVSDACIKAGISRSSYYKYSGLIFESSTHVGKRMEILIKAENQKGVLSRIINCISNNGGNILSINQDMPIHNLAYITIMIDVSEMILDIGSMVEKIKVLSDVKNVSILLIE